MVSFIKIEGRTLKGIFQERPNRFLALVKIENRILPSFLPNPGRMHELLTPGTEVVLREVLKENRKTGYDLIGVFHNGHMASVDSRVANKLILEALRNRGMEELLVVGLNHPDVPTIHNFCPKKYSCSIRHCGYGFFEGKTEKGAFSFDGGGAMVHCEFKEGWLSWSPLRVENDGVLELLGYDFKKVEVALQGIIANDQRRVLQTS